MALVRVNEQGRRIGESHRNARHSDADVERAIAAYEVLRYYAKVADKGLPEPGKMLLFTHPHRSLTPPIGTPAPGTPASNSTPDFPLAGGFFDCLTEPLT